MTKTKKGARPRKKPAISGRPVPLRKGKEVLSRVNANNTVSILHMAQYDVYYTLSSVAMECWQLIDGKKTEEQIVHLLQRKHPQVSKKVPGKVRGWIRDFKKYGLLV